MINNIDLMTPLYFLGYLSFSFLSIIMFVGAFIKLNDDFLEQAKHGNIASSLLISSFILSLTLSSAFTFMKQQNIFILLLISAILNLIVLIFHQIFKSIFKDYYDEILLNNNISISIIFSFVIICLGIIVGLSFK